jgi:hypothetical protein
MVDELLAFKRGTLNVNGQNEEEVLLYLADHKQENRANP